MQDYFWSRATLKSVTLRSQSRTAAHMWYEWILDFSSNISQRLFHQTPFGDTHNVPAWRMHCTMDWQLYGDARMPTRKLNKKSYRREVFGVPVHILIVILTLVCHQLARTHVVGRPHRRMTIQMRQKVVPSLHTHRMMYSNVPLWNVKCTFNNYKTENALPSADRSSAQGSRVSGISTFAVIKAILNYCISVCQR